MKPAVLLASELLQCLAKNQFERLVPHYTPFVKQVLTHDLLSKSWSGVLAKTGTFQYVTDVKHVPPAVYIRCRCEKNDMEVTLVFDNANLITGLHFNPATNYTIPEYSNADLFKEEEIEIGEGNWKLPGKITVPISESKFPCLILVHGSGALDEDETIGPNKPFKDIAFGLSSRGIAVLRYEKRNFHYGKSLTEEEKNNFTLMEECVEDAMSAVTLAANHPKIDRQNIFVLGHSLGGYATPLIAQLSGEKVKGIISLAGNVRNIGVMILDQMRYLAYVTGQIDTARLETIETAVQRIHDPSLSEHTPKDQLMNIPPKYWLFLRKYDPVKMAQSISQKILILQASRDYQVTREDFELWKSIKDEKKVKSKEYTGLNHLMMVCDFSVKDKMATPEEYSVPGNVAKEVIEDICAFILGN